MRLSAPIYSLKRKARRLARERHLPLHKALDHIAVNEGFQSWSHLASASSKQATPAHVFSRLSQGELMLIGARPRQGKTRLGIELASIATEFGRKGFFFTLDYNTQDVAEHCAALGRNAPDSPNSMTVDTSDDVSADYIMDRLSGCKDPALIVIDYLQLLDQKRSNPSLEDQIRTLRRFVKATGAICAVISQIDRSFDLSGKSMPELSDVRLPNPLDLSAFDKACFLHNDDMQMARV